MFRELRALARESVVYGLSTVLGRMLGFLLTPLFSHLLDPSENGVVTTVYAYIAFLTVLYGLGLDTAYLRLGRRQGRPDGEAFTGALVSVAALALAVSAALHLAAEPVARALGVPPGLSDVVRYAAWILAVDAAALMPFAELRGSHRAGTYAGVKLLSIAMNLVLAWVFTARLGLGVRGVFLANLVASCSALAMLAPVIASRLERPERAKLAGMLAFGLPLVLAGLASMAVQTADRPILRALTDLATAGIYGTGYKLGIFMMLVVSMFDQAWKPFILERAERPDAGLIVARVLTYFAAIAAWVFLAIALFVGPAVTAPLFLGKPLIHPAYWSGLAVVPVVTLGYLFNGLYFVMLAPLMLDRRTGAVGAATWLGAAVNIGANFALIPRWGMMGAAWATLLAYAAMAAAVWTLGRSGRETPYEGRRLLALAGWTFILWFPTRNLGLAARGAALLAYPAGLLLSGFLTPEELSELRDVLSARARRT